VIGAATGGVVVNITVVVKGADTVGSPTAAVITAVTVSWRVGDGATVVVGRGVAVLVGVAVGRNVAVGKGRVGDGAGVGLLAAVGATVGAVVGMIVAVGVTTAATVGVTACVSVIAVPAWVTVSAAVATKVGLLRGVAVNAVTTADGAIPVGVNCVLVTWGVFTSAATAVVGASA